VEIKEASITGDSLSAKHLNDASALSYVLILVNELQQYDLFKIIHKVSCAKHGEDLRRISMGEQLHRPLRMARRP